MDTSGHHAGSSFHAGLSVLLGGLFALLCACSARADLRGDYAAVSLKGLEQEVSSAAPSRGSGMGFSHIRAIVVDEASDDVIVAGPRATGADELTVDDLGTLARLGSGFPGGRISFSLETKPGSGNGSMLVTEFHGPIDRTSIGLAMFEADYLMKKLALGIVESGIEGFVDYREYVARVAKTQGIKEISSRFWFEPQWENQTEYAETLDVVIVWNPLVRVRVETLLVNGKRPDPGAEDKAAQDYADGFNSAWQDICRKHPVIRKTENIIMSQQALGTLARKCGSLPAVSVRMGFWSNKFKPALSEIPAEVPLLARPITVEGKDMTVVGGVRLGGLGVSLRKSGDPALKAFKEAVLLTRPGRMPTRWEFSIREDYRISAPGLPRDVAAVSEMYADARDAFAKGDADASAEEMGRASRLLANVLKTYPDSVEARLLHTVAKRQIALYQGHLGDVEKVLYEFSTLQAWEPTLIEPRYEQAKTLLILGRTAEAIPILREAIEKSPDFGPALLSLGLAYRAEGNTELAKEFLMRFAALKGQPTRLTKQAKDALAALSGKSKPTLPAKNLEHKVEFKVGEGWVRLSDDEVKRIPGSNTATSKLIMAYRHPDDPYCNLSVRVQSWKGATLSDAQLNAEIATLDRAYQSKLNGYRKEDARIVEMAGAKGIQMKYSSDQTAGRMTECATTLGKEGKLLTLRFSAKQAAYETCWEESFEGVIQSFQWGDTRQLSDNEPNNGS